MHKWIAGSALAALLAAGGTGVAVAQSSPGPSTTNPSATSQAPGANQQSQAPSHVTDPPKHAHLRAVFRRSLRGALRVSAKTIRISPKELREELKAGHSIADVATAHKVLPQTVIGTLVKDADARIDKAVTNHHLTAEQATKLKARVPKAVNRLVNHHRAQVHLETPTVPTPPTTS